MAIKRFIILVQMLALIGICQAQDSPVRQPYRRSSLYSIMLNTGIKYSDEMELVFADFTVPDKFNDHSLGLKSIKDLSKVTDKRVPIERFLYKSQLAKRMVSKWFCRDKTTGAFSVETVAERGNYNASMIDVAIARSTIRGEAMLADAGEELIGNTFLLVNEISYIDKEINAEAAAAIFGTIAAIAGTVGDVAGGGNTKAVADLTKSIAELSAISSEMVAGFSVKVTSYLYQLDWNDSVAAIFYADYYFDKDHIDARKKAAYENDTELFTLRFIGQQTVRSDKTALRGVHTNGELISKTMQRAIDKSIVELQRQNEVFRVKVPIFEIADNEIHVQVGLKEGVSEKSRFEVLEQLVDENGRTKYKRVGTIKPRKDKIWDNRFMAIEEEAENADLNYTTFEVLTGYGFYPGMLVREIKF
ncbi:MAG: hypothetical protein IKN59_07905 [Paludibacteraceae bacterium]|nr:hypothetical protein [Paludibacteraceae bacterium]